MHWRRVWPSVCLSVRLSDVRPSTHADIESKPTIIGSCGFTLGQGKDSSYCDQMSHHSFRRKSTSVASNETGVSKDSENADFLPINYNVSEMIEDRHIITMENNRKSHTGFPLAFSGFNGFRGFDLPRQQWSLLNRFRTEQGHCGACRRKWRLTDTDLCPCGETQTMSHIVEFCPLTKLNGGLSRLHPADEDAVSWLTNYCSWHAYEKKKTGY